MGHPDVGYCQPTKMRKLLMALHGDIATSSTKRLHGLLSTLQTFSVPPHGENRLFEILPKAMSILDGDQNRRAMTAVALLSDMFAAVEKEVDDSFPDQVSRDLHKRPLRTLASTFSPLNLGSLWAQLKPNLRAQDLTGLEYTAHAIELLRSEKLLSLEDLQKVSETLIIAETQVEASHLPNEAKRILLESLARLKAAIEVYPLTGVDGIRDALFAYTGAVAYYKEQILTTCDQTMSQSIWSVLSKASDLIAIAQVAWVGYQALLPVISDLRFLGQ